MAMKSSRNFIINLLRCVREHQKLWTLLKFGNVQRGFFYPGTFFVENVSRNVPDRVSGFIRSDFFNFLRHFSRDIRKCLGKNVSETCPRFYKKWSYPVDQLKNCNPAGLDFLNRFCTSTIVVCKANQLLFFHFFFLTNRH